MSDESRSFTVEDWNPLTQRKPTPKRELDADGRPVFRVRSAPPWTGDPPRSESITRSTADRCRTMHAAWGPASSMTYAQTPSS